MISTLGVILFVCPDTLWPYWIIIPFTLLGAALSWVNMGTLLSVEASDAMQGRAMGVSGSMWSIGQIVSPLIAGPLAGWNIYSPLLVGAAFVFICFIYFLLSHRKQHRV